MLRKSRQYPKIRHRCIRKFLEDSAKEEKTVDIFRKRVYNNIVEVRFSGIYYKKQVSPSGMAAASQAVPGEFDSRHLLQKQRAPYKGAFVFWILK